MIVGFVLLEFRNVWEMFCHLYTETSMTGSNYVLFFKIMKVMIVIMNVVITTEEVDEQDMKASVSTTFYLE